MITCEVYQINEKDFGYKILDDGVAFVIQEFHPNINGFNPMTEIEARELSEQIINELTNKGLS